MLDEWDENSGPKCGIVTFNLAQTLSKNGTVSRGICQNSDDNKLIDITETHGIREKDGKIYDENKNVLPASTPVSMNMWCMTASILPFYEEAFIKFLSKDLFTPKSEFYIPSVIDELIKSEIISCDLLASPCKWFGVTYKEDKPEVIEALKKAVDAGIYPPSLHI